MTPARQFDYGAIKSVAQYVAGKHDICISACPVNREDLEQEAILALLRGRKSVKGPMQDLLRQVYGRYYEKRGATIPLENYIESAPPPPSPERSVRLPVLEFLRPLSRIVLRMRYWEGLEYAEIGRRLGKSESGAKQIESKAIGILRRQFR